MTFLSLKSYLWQRKTFLFVYKFFVIKYFRFQLIFLVTFAPLPIKKIYSSKYPFKLLSSFPFWNFNRTFTPQQKGCVHTSHYVLVCTVTWHQTVRRKLTSVTYSAGFSYRCTNFWCPRKQTYFFLQWYFL